MEINYTGIMHPYHGLNKDDSVKLSFHIDGRAHGMIPAAAAKDGFSRLVLLWGCLHLRSGICLSVANKYTTVSRKSIAAGSIGLLIT